jgi:hypothetical protein
MSSGIWVKSPFKPEQKPEQRRETEENGVLGGLAVGFDGFGESYPSGDKNTPGPQSGANRHPFRDERQYR